MSPEHHTDPQHPESQQLTHELANLLDASMRNLGLSLTQLDEPGHDVAVDRVIHRLRTTDQALKRMSLLIKQWMGRGDAGFEPMRQRGTLGEAVQHAADLMGPAADQRHALLQIDLHDEADILPAGPIYGLILNALRNSLDAIDTADRDPATRRPPDNPHRITVTARVEHQEVHLRITDTGCGLEPSLIDADGRFRFGRTTKAGGHGLGMTISRDIATQLGGQLRLTNADGGGAVLSVRYPVSAVMGEGEGEGEGF